MDKIACNMRSLRYNKNSETKRRTLSFLSYQFVSFSLVFFFFFMKKRTIWNFPLIMSPNLLTKILALPGLCHKLNVTRALYVWLSIVYKRKNIHINKNSGSSISFIQSVATDTILNKEELKIDETKWEQCQWHWEATKIEKNIGRNTYFVIIQTWIKIQLHLLLSMWPWKS